MRGRGRQRWTVLAVGTAAQTASWGGIFAVPVLAPTLQDKYSLGLSGIGFAIAISSAGLTLTFLLWGLLADRLGERVVLSLGMGGGAGALVGAAYSPDFTSFVLASLLFGMCAASATAASTRAVIAWFEPNERGFALSVRQTSLPVGALVSALALPAIVDAGGLRAAFLALAGAQAAAAVASAVWLREAPTRAAESHTETMDVRPLRDRRIWRLSIAGVFLVGPQIAISSFAVVFFHEERGLSLGEAAGVLAGIRLAGTIVQLAAGSWSDRRGERLGPLRLLSVVFALMLVATAVLTDVSTPVAIAVWIAAGAISSSWNALTFAAVAEVAGYARSGAALGLQLTVLGVGSFATPLIFAAVVSATSWRVGLAVFAAGPVTAYLLMGPLTRSAIVPRVGAPEVP